MAAIAFWAAVGAGVLETTVHLFDDSGPLVDQLPGVAMRLLIYAAVSWVVWQLWRGRGWAKPVLAVGLGLVGTASLIIEPITAIADGASIGDSIASASAAALAIGVFRIAHILLVVVAMALMFLPRAIPPFADSTPFTR